MLLAPDQKFRVGYQLLSWGRYYPANWWGGCRDLAALGFSGVEGESTISHLYEGRWEEFRRRMQKFGLQLAALYSTSDLQKKEESYQNLTRNLQAAEFLQAMGGRVLVVGGSETHNPTSDDFHRLADTANLFQNSQFRGDRTATDFLDGQDAGIRRNGETFAGHRDA